MRARLLPALLAAVTFVALVIAAFGFIGLFTGSDVIEDRRAGTLIGPVMVAVTGLAFFLGLLWMAAVRDSGRSPVSLAVAVPLGCTVLYSLAGAVIMLFATGLPGQFVIFLGTHLISLYSVAIAVSALVVALGFWLVSLTPRAR